MNDAYKWYCVSIVPRDEPIKMENNVQNEHKKKK